MFHFVDDYQLEDIFNWGTEFLQEHVDKNIVGLDIGDGTIYKSPDLYKGSLTSTIKSNSQKRNLWTKDNIEDLFSAIYQEEKCITIYYKVDDICEYGESFDEQEYLGNNRYDELYDTTIICCIYSSQHCACRRWLPVLRGKRSNISGSVACVP